MPRQNWLARTEESGFVFDHAAPRRREIRSELRDTGRDPGRYPDQFGVTPGVLLNMAGQVIGVTSPSESPGARLRRGVFCHPFRHLQRMTPRAAPSHSWLGISGLSLFPDIEPPTGLRWDQWRDGDREDRPWLR